jgi:flagellar biosynthesis/type III secretory pathway chaperone
MSIQPLITIMEQLLESHEILLELSREKTKELVSNNVNQLNLIVNKESKLVRHIGELDKQRFLEISKYLVSRGYNPNPQITVSDLIRLIFKAEEKQALLNAHNLLIAVLKSLRQVNESNKQLIQQSLSFIDYSIDLVMGPSEEDVVYQNPTQQKSDKRTGIFDRRA